MNLDVINGFLATLQNKELWTRIGVGVLGSGFISIGLVMIVLSDKSLTDAAGSAAQIGLTKTPVGAAAVATKEALT